MRIDPTHGIDSRPIGDGKLPAAGTYTPAPAGPSIEQAFSLDRSQQPLIDRAKALDEVNLQAVEEARKLLESGQLDTPQASLRAADAMLKFGL